MRKLNILQIVIHFLAVFCFIFSGRALSWIYNIRTLEITEKYGVKNVVNDFNKYGIEPIDVWNVTSLPIIATLIGFLLGIIISLIITNKKKWSSINCLIIFIISYGVYYFKLPLFDYLEKFHTPRFIQSLLLQLIVTSAAFFVFGLFLFYSKKINALIEKNNKR